MRSAFRDSPRWVHTHVASDSAETAISRETSSTSARCETRTARGREWS